MKPVTSRMLATMLAFVTIAAGGMLFSCKSPLFGLGGQVDTAVPGITVAEVEEGGVPRALVNGDYVRGSIALRGGVTDDIGIAAVALSFTDNAVPVSLPATINASAQTWEALIDTATYLDGDKDFTVTVTDTAGKSSTSRFVLYFDNKPPTVLVSVPTASEGTVIDTLYGTIDIKGSAADQFGIRKVRVFLYRASDGVLLYSSPDDASIGTNSFALQLDTSSLIGKTGSERGYVYVRAWDRSGNTNTQFYRLDEIKSLNADQGATVEELHALETGAAATVNGIDLAQIASTRRYEPGTGYADDKLLSYWLDQSANLPVITVSNPEAGKTSDQNLLSKSAKAMGLVQDANGIDLIEMQFKSGVQESIWYSDANPGVDGDDIDVSGTGRVVNWTTRILFGGFADSGFGALGVAVYSIRLRATDSDGNQGVSDWVPFTIDADVPDITIDSPAPGDYLAGDPIVITGTAKSYGTADIDKVELSINGLFAYTAATCTPPAGAKDVAWTFNITNALVPADGTYTIKAQVTDTANKQSLYNIVVTIDRTAPHDLAFISPARGTSINGYPTLMGQAKDNVLLGSVHLVFEKKGEDIPLADTYNWNYELDAGALANTNYGFDLGNNIYRVPLRIRAIDQAGNEALSPAFGAVPASPGAGSYYLDVDLDGDKPEITNIVSPGDENAPASPYLITGSIKFQGTATDDDRLHHVEMALIALSGATESWRTLDGATEVAADTFYSVSGSTLWSCVLNDNGALYALADLPGHAGDFKIIVRAVDTKDLVSPTPAPDLVGDPKTIYVRFDNTLPGVINLLPEESTVHSGTFPLTFTAQDNNSIVLAQVSYNNGSTYSNLTLVPGAMSPKEYEFSESVNSKTVNSAALANSSGTLYMRLRLKDENNITEKSFKYLIDNIAPVNVTAPSGATMSAISNRMYTDAGASLAEILGVVNDTGTVRGIDRMEVYFERAGTVYRLNPDFPASNVAADSYPFSNGSFLYATDPDYRIIVDTAENYEDSDGDGYQESITQGTGGYTWGARFDSSKISDGDLTVHYVAWDQAGNSAHFAVPGIVRNDPPVIDAMTAGTDLNGDLDATDDGERIKLIRQADGSWRGYTLDSLGTQLGTEKAYDLDDPILTVRNSRFSFSMTSTGGNAPIQYCALAPDGSTKLVDWTTTDNYTVTAFASSGWTEDAGNTLSIQARDSAYGTPLATEAILFKVSVDNNDGTPPVLALAPLGREFSEPVSGQSLSYALRAEDDVSSYGDNVYWLDTDSDGICDVGEHLGHVELAAASLYHGLDADVSGIIRMRGKVYDDQRVGKITVAFNVAFDTNGTAAGGSVSADTEIDLASFTAGSLSVVAARAASQDPAANTLTFGLSGKNSPEISDELGHAMNYVLTWNTAFISGVAAKDVTVTVRAYNSDLSMSAPQSLPFDVVPYISGLSTALNTMLGAEYNRTATGKYTVYVRSMATAAYETVVVNGFNLNPADLTAGATSDIRLSKDPDGFDPTFTVKQGTGLPGSAVAADYRSLSATVQATGSGYLTVVTAGIPTLNNINAPGTGNTEPSLLQAALSDDRYLALWDFTPLRANASAPNAKNAQYPSMAMAGNIPQFAYVNNSGGYGLAEFWTGAAEKKMYENWDLFTYSSLALNDDNGRAALYDINIVAQGTNLIGDKGGITVNFIYDPPDTTWGGTTYYYRDYNVWLDNLYKAGNLAVLGRYQYPTIRLVGNNALTHAFYSVYDSIDDRVIFRYFRVGTNQSDVGGGVPANATKITDTATNLYLNRNDVLQRNETGAWPDYSDAGGGADNIRLGQNNNSGNTSAGQYFATGTGVGLHTATAGISTGALTARGIVVYYATNKLYYMYATNDANTSWSVPVELDSNVGGDYVSMVVDKDDHIHIAYQDSFAGDVKYIYIPSPWIPATRKRVTVDSYLTVGGKLTLTVPAASNSPYIAYKGLGNTAKVAWYPGSPAVATLADGINASGKLDGSWEVQVMPVTIVDSDTNRFNAGVGTDGRPVIGYSNNKAGIQGIEYLTGLDELAN